MGIFESHAHYDDEAFDDDRDELLRQLKEENVEYVIDVGASMESTVKSLELAKKYDFIYSAVGVHPNETGPLNEEFIQFMKEQAYTNPKVVAVAGIGRDYYWDELQIILQKKWFK